MKYGIAFTKHGSYPSDKDPIVSWEKDVEGRDVTWDDRDTALGANDAGGWFGYVMEYPHKPHTSQGSAMPHFTPEDIREAVIADEPRLFKAWSEGRPENWKCDTPTHDMVCLAGWLSERLAEMVALGLITNDDRILQQQLFHRWSRSLQDLFELTAEIINDTIDGRIVRDRTPHRRWGCNAKS